MVKLIENYHDVPKMIGEAEIIFRDRVKENGWSSLPPPVQRVGKKIFLDPGNSGRFYSLRGGSQFLFTFGVDSGRQLFFGGMDESPFLVELQYHLIEKLMEGEREFFEALKPPIIRDWEAKIGIKAKRQGDFFAVSQKKKIDFASFFRNRLANYSFRLSVAKGMNLRNTRHQFEGLLAVRESGAEMIGEGKIIAPDHEPLILNQPHLIEQAVGFVRPQEAD